MVPICLLSLLKPVYIPDRENLVERMSRSIITGVLAAISLAFVITPAGLGNTPDGVLAAISLAFVIGTVSAATLKQEPPEDALRSGKTVLVDDGSCPAGQIKQVTGGSDIKNGSTVGGGSPRQRKCIERK